MYGASPGAFTPCGRIAFLGDRGPEGIASSDMEVTVGTGWLAGGATTLLCAPAEENFEDILDSHEFRRNEPGDDGFGEATFNVVVRSEDPLLENVGRLGTGMDFGGVVRCSFPPAALALGSGFDSFSVGIVFVFTFVDFAW